MIEIKPKETGGESPKVPPICGCYCWPQQQTIMLVWGFAQGPGCYCWCPDIIGWGGMEIASWQ